jgi:hypothetical protein
MEEKLRCGTGRECPWQVKGTTLGMSVNGQQGGQTIPFISTAILTRSHFGSYERQIANLQDGQSAVTSLDNNFESDGNRYYLIKHPAFK